MGTNDSKTSNVPATTTENFTEAYNHLLDELLKVNSEMRVIICTVPYAYSDIYNINNDNIANIIAPVQREIASQRNMELVDLYKITQNKSLLFGDGVHPGTRGYAMFVEVFAEVIENFEEALTEEFLADIDKRYNDPTYSIENIQASLSTNEEQIILTVTGNIEFADTSYIRLVAETGNDGQMSKYELITLEEDGAFSVSMRIDDLTATDWYIIRIYLTEDFNYVVTLDNTDHTEGEVVSTTARKVTVVSWSNRFNLKIEDNNYVTLTSSAITTTDGVKLTLTGTTNVNDLRLYVGVNPTGDAWRDIVNVTVNDGAFTVEYDLDNLFNGTDIVSNYVNVRLYYGDTNSYFVVSRTATTIDGEAAAVGASFHTDDKTITIQSWTDSGVPTLSFAVSEYNPLAPAIEVTNLAFNEGNLVVTGTANSAVESLVLYLYNSKEGIETYNVTVTIGDEGAFTAQIGIEQLTLADGEWYYLWSSINGGDKQNVKFAHDESVRHQYENRVYRFTGWGGNVAIVYSTLTVTENSVTLTSVTVTETEGKINLTIVGTTNDEGIRLYVGADPANEDKYNHYEDITVGDDGAFTITFDLATCPVGGWYNIRLYYSDNQYYAVSYEEAVNSNGEAIAKEDVFYGTDKSVTVKSWKDKNDTVNTFSIDVKEYDSSYNITATSITFDEQYLVVAGTATGNVQSLALALHNDSNMQDNIRVTATVNDGAFEVKLDLTEITLGAGSWLYLWSSVNGGDDAKVVYAKNNTTHIYQNRQYRFEYWEGIAIAYSAYVEPTYTAESISATVIETEGKINLTITGTTNDNGIRLYVGADPANEDKYNHYEDITVGDDGAFTITFDLTTCPVGGWYNIRLYYSDNEYYAVSYEEAVNAKGQTLAVDNMFYGTDKSVTVKSWNDKAGTVKTFSIEVKTYDSSYTVTPTSIAFDNGYFVLTGTASNVRNLYVYLINTNVADSLDNYVEAEIDGSNFTARLPLATLVGYNKTATPFNLRYKVNDISKATENVAPAEMDMSQVAWSNLKLFYLGTNNGCVAVYYTSDYAYGLTEAVVQNIDGKATLVLAGTLSNAETLPETVYLLLDENGNGTAKQKILAENMSTTAGTFRFEVDVTALEGSEEASNSNGATCRHYYIRLYTGTNLTAENYSTGTKLADVNSRWLADKLFKAISVVGDSSDYYFIRNTTNATYNTLGIIRVGKDASAIKLGDIDDITLGYYARDSKTIDLSQYVDANGTTVTYSASSSDNSLATAEIADGMLTVTATGLSGTAKITVTVLSNGESAFNLEFDVTLDDSTITKTNNYQSFLSADSWQNILNDGGNSAQYDTYTNSVLFQQNNNYQQIGAATHISFDLWVNAGGQYGFEIWFRSTTNDNNVAGNKYVMNGYDTWNNNIIYIADETGNWLATFPKFPAGEFTRFDITMLDVYDGETLVKTLINIYINGQKVNLSGDSATNGTIVDNSPIAADDGIYFILKTWGPQVAIRTTEEIVVANPDAIKVAAVGDSITYGHSWHNESYPTYLAAELGDDYNVGNYGLNGASVTGYGGSSLKYANQSQYTDSVAFDADIIVIMLGANDANGWANASATYESDLRALIAAYKTACPNATILLVTSAPTLDNNLFGIPNDTIKDSVNPIQRSVAQDLELTLVDLRAQMEAAEGGYNGFFRDDGVHLSVEGAQFVANVIANAIKALD